MTLRIANNAQSTLAGSISASDTAIAVQVGDGAKFPGLSGDDWFPLTLVNASNGYEIVRCTARVGDVLTIVRAQEGTAAMPFSAGDSVGLRMTAGAIQTLIPDGVSLLTNNNLSDVADKAAARINLGLGTAATLASTDVATAAQGAKADAAMPAANVKTVALSGSYNDLSPKFGESFNYGTVSTSGWAAASKISNGYALTWDIGGAGGYFGMGHLGFSGPQFYIGLANNRLINGTATTTYAFSVIPAGGANGGTLNGYTIITSGNIASQSVAHASTADTATTATNVINTPVPAAGAVGSYILLDTSANGLFYNVGTYSLPGFPGTWTATSNTTSQFLTLFQRVS